MATLPDMKRKAIAKMYGQISEAELMCRMLEAAQNMRRPPGSTAEEALTYLDPESKKWLRREALAAMQYFMECLNASERPS